MMRMLALLAAAGALAACARNAPPAPVEYRTGAMAGPTQMASARPASARPAPTPAFRPAANVAPAPPALPRGEVVAAPLAAPVAAAPLPAPTAAPAPTAPLSPPPAAPVQAAVATPAIPVALPTPPRRSSGRFAWPAQGPIISPFGSKPGGLQNDGINIALPKGAPVRAAENGVVAYSGNEIRGFGNLLLIKHDGGWMSAYGHNDQLLVKQGDKVKRGQLIAKAGATGSVATPQLHFELRKAGGAVDPLRHLDGGGDAAELVSRVDPADGRRNPG